MFATVRQDAFDPNRKFFEHEKIRRAFEGPFFPCCTNDTLRHITNYSYSLCVAEIVSNCDTEQIVSYSLVYVRPHL